MNKNTDGEVINDLQAVKELTSRCTYNENKCPKCGKPMSQELDEWDEKCSKCDFVYKHCGACKEDYY